MTSSFIVREPCIETFGEQENLEDISLVWLDSNIHDPNDNIDTQIRLRSIINHLNVYTNMNDCLQYIQSINEEKIFLIVSGSLGRRMVPIIYPLQVIVYIYVFCNDKEKHEQWSKDYPKIHGVFSQKDQLFMRLIKDFRSYSNDLMPTSLLKADAYQNGINVLSKENAAFMWHQILLKVLRTMPQTNNAKNDLLSICRLQYKGNDNEIKKIVEFRDNYNTLDAIRWYTRDSFLYRILNNGTIHKVSSAYFEPFYEVASLCLGLFNKR
ncbi:unnamed protein product [Didymodactylos carnosus]|uniref:Uncharacterized protein n=1 Tax=Didymodactylos carnosus TaxID=1234261 RepID=A0A8S2KEC9_9BILA|nr:unnamed protein product [Didymodactylos carnosus]CAF3847593.1 unnamed protein product [Didymodactylos carnosus]